MALPRTRGDLAREVLGESRENVKRLAWGAGETKRYRGSQATLGPADARVPRAQSLSFAHTREAG